MLFIEVLLKVCKSFLTDFYRRFNKFGFEFHEDTFIDYTKHRPDLEIWNYARYTIRETIEVVWYPLVCWDLSIWWCDIPLLFLYDSKMLFVLGVLFSENDPSGCLTISYITILLGWCIEGSHGLATKEGFDTLVVASGLLFSKFASYYCLRWAHHYLMTHYGNDYHLVVPTYDEDKMAYLAHQFIQMLEVPFLD